MVGGSPRPTFGASSRPAPAQRGTVTVVVVVDGFHYDGRDYCWRDEVEIPRAHLDAWLQGGWVRLAEEDTAQYSAEQCVRDVRDVVERFLSGRR